MHTYFFNWFYKYFLHIPFSIVREAIPQYACATAMAFVNVLCGCIGALLFQPLTGWILSITGELSKMTGLYSPTSYSFMYALTILPLCFVAAIVLVFMIDCKKGTVY